MTTTAPEPRKVGRPARIGRADIAQAVLDLGLEDLTMKRVADHLGVSVPGLYHHVSGRDDLLRLAAEHSMARFVLPTDQGQPWSDWLREWGRYIRLAMGEPELVQQYVGGAVPRDRIVDSVDLVLGVLLREGFEPPAAQAAWETVANLALGYAVNEIRDREADADGSWIDRLSTEVAARPTGALPAIRALAATGYQPDGERDFEDALTTVLLGIAARNDLDPVAVTAPSAPGARSG